MTDPTRPHVSPADERKALRHLVAHELSVTEARAVAVAGRAEPENPAGWEALTRALHERNPRTCTALVTGPALLVDAVRDVLTPLTARVEIWDGRRRAAAPDLVCAALPWRLDSIADLPGLPRPLHGRPSAILPLSFSEHAVMVGPIVDHTGPCLACVQPLLEQSGGLPDHDAAPALFAFAAGAAGLYVRALCARSDAATAMSMTFDITTPRVEHRLWSCTPNCRTAA